MRYPASEKLQIIRLVEQSHLPVRRTLEKLGILPGTFYRWYDRYREGGIEALADHRSRPDRVWNRIPDDVRGHQQRDAEGRFVGLLALGVGAFGATFLQRAAQPGTAAEAVAAAFAGASPGSVS